MSVDTKTHTLPFDYALASVFDHYQRYHLLHVVVDTNVFLSNLNYVDFIKGKMLGEKKLDLAWFILNLKFCELVSTAGAKRIKIHVPYTVLEELDRKKRGATAQQAQSANKFIEKCCTTLDVILSDGNDERRFMQISCPDDEIINYCLQLMDNKYDNVTFLTYDINARLKARAKKVFITFTIPSITQRKQPKAASSVREYYSARKWARK